MSQPKELLLLDSAIRDWVVLPMVLMLVLVGMGRAYVQGLIKSEPKVTEKDVKETRYKQTCMSASRLHLHGRFINERAFKMRKGYLTNKREYIMNNIKPERRPVEERHVVVTKVRMDEDGNRVKLEDGSDDIVVTEKTVKLYQCAADAAKLTGVSEKEILEACNDSAGLKKPTKGRWWRYGSGLLREEGVPGPGNPMMSNPGAMMDMLKGQFTYMVPNFVMMAFVNYFFNGFVCLKVPFPLPSTHFKSMLQRGVDLTALDVSYVSSLCCYFLVTFGLNGVYRLLLEEGQEVDETRMMQMQMGMGMMGGGGGQGFDAKGAYSQHREVVEITRHEFDKTVDAAERQLLGDRYPEACSSGDINLSSFGIASSS